MRVLSPPMFFFYGERRVSAPRGCYVLRLCCSLCGLWSWWSLCLDAEGLCYRLALAREVQLNLNAWSLTLSLLVILNDKLSFAVEEEPEGCTILQRNISCWGVNGAALSIIKLNLFRIDREGLSACLVGSKYVCLSADLVSGYLNLILRKGYLVNLCSILRMKNT